MHPRAGAGPLRVTVPVEVLPPTTDAGLRTTEVTVGKELKLTAETFAPLIVALWLVGLKTYPLLPGVTVYEPFSNPVKL